MRSEILDKVDDPTLKVYTVWLPCLDSDERTRVRTSLMADPRVTHYWDGELKVGTWFGDEDRTAWDIYYLYDGSVKWTEKYPEPLTSWGFPVIKKSEKLTADLEELLDRAKRDE